MIILKPWQVAASLFVISLCLTIVICVEYPRWGAFMTFPLGLVIGGTAIEAAVGFWSRNESR